ncbi:MAG: dihydrodipicolinate synthase family protein [Acidobacteria bacterium]|nr:dihydrodipicolinate synthase family protein [Acidobacteriota bacterium]
MEGVIAALLLPRDNSGRPDWTSFDSTARFICDVGASGLCVNGATGEYPGMTPDEHRQVIERARDAATKPLLVVTGVGASRWDWIVANLRSAEQAGADAVLAPTPHFFKYSPADLEEFYRAVAQESRLPVLIYNLPAFTAGLEPELAHRIISEVDNIAGVKDSSGRLDLLDRLTRSSSGAVRLVGNDRALPEAIRRGLCGGVISGVAGVLPELTLALWKSAEDHATFSNVRMRLESLLAALDSFPTPWGLKLIAEVRGLSPAWFPLPLSAERKAHAVRFQEWIAKWWAESEKDLTRVLGIPVSFQPKTLCETAPSHSR